MTWHISRRTSCIALRVDTDAKGNGRIYKTSARTTVMKLRVKAWQKREIKGNTTTHNHRNLHDRPTVPSASAGTIVPLHPVTKAPGKLGIAILGTLDPHKEGLDTDTRNMGTWDWRTTGEGPTFWGREGISSVTSFSASRNSWVMFCETSEVGWVRGRGE